MQSGEARRAEPELRAEALAGGGGLGERDDGPRVAEPRAVRQQADLRASSIAQAMVEPMVMVSMPARLQA